MAESLIGRWFYVCNCGPQCRCAYRSDVPSDCPCNKPAARRRVLVEDEHNFYVCETGEGVEASNALGQEPFKCSNGRSLQAFPKAWRQTKRTFMYRGKQVELEQRDDRCTVKLEGRSFSAMRHVERGVEGWMGYPCYLMFQTPEKFARALVDDWDIIGNEKILAPPEPGHAHGSGSGSGDDCSQGNGH